MMRKNSRCGVPVFSLFAFKMEGALNPVEFLKKPPVILRLVSILFAIIVFGCISSGGYNTYGTCLYHGDNGACNFGVGIGVIAFLLCIVFIAIDSQYDTITNQEHKKQVNLAELGFSAFWAFLWFVCFCYLADMWRKTNTGPLDGHQKDNCRAAIAFSFFSIFTWIALAVFAFQKYRQSDNEFGYDRDNLAGDTYASPYAPFPPNTSEAGDPYQSAPFTESQGQGPVNTPSEVPNEFKQASY